MFILKLIALISVIIANRLETIEFKITFKK